MEKLKIVCTQDKLPSRFFKPIHPAPITCVAQKIHRPIPLYRVPQTINVDSDPSTRIKKIII